MPRKGVPLKAEEDRSKPHSVRWPERLWRRLVALVPPGKRAKFIHRAVEKALDEASPPPARPSEGEEA